jgi:hypothetical protein
MIKCSGKAKDCKDFMAKLIAIFGGKTTIKEFCEMEGKILYVDL